MRLIIQEDVPTDTQSRYKTVSTEWFVSDDKQSVQLDLESISCGADKVTEHAELLKNKGFKIES